MKTNTTILLLGTAMTLSSLGSDPVITYPQKRPTDSNFNNARRPISNPTLFDLALPRTNLHPIAIHQEMPNQAAILGGGSVPLGGDFQVYALQLEFAFSDRLSFVATKDGFVDFNPDNVLSEQTGFANLAAGIKYAFIYQPENEFAVSGTATVELPTGNSDVTQGTGDGAINFILSTLKLAGSLQFAAGAGVQIPFDNDETSTTSFISTHLSYELNPFFIPLIELNWFHVISEGDGKNRFGSQIGGGLPSVIAFEGGDLLNWGASNSKDNANIVTLAAGFRSNLNHVTSLGMAYEIPMTEKKENLMESRITLDLLYNF